MKGMSANAQSLFYIAIDSLPQKGANQRTSEAQGEGIATQIPHCNALGA